MDGKLAFSGGIGKLADISKSNEGCKIGISSFETWLSSAFVRRYSASGALR
jgi:hypothetical protein